MERMYKLIAENKNTGKKTVIGVPDTHGRIIKLKWAHLGGVCEQYNNFLIEEVR